ISGAIWTSCCCSDVLVVPVRNVGMIATRNDPPQISRTASPAEDAWTTVNPSASSARAISSRSVLISLTIRTEDIGDLTTQMDKERNREPENPKNPATIQKSTDNKPEKRQQPGNDCSMPPEWAAFSPCCLAGSGPGRERKASRIHRFAIR